MEEEKERTVRNLRKGHERVAGAVELAVLVGLAELADADGRHADDAAAAEAEQRGKGVEEADVVADGEPEAEGHDQGPDERQDHGVEAAVAVGEVA